MQQKVLWLCCEHHGLQRGSAERLSYSQMLFVLISWVPEVLPVRQVLRFLTKESTSFQSVDQRVWRKSAACPEWAAVGPWRRWRVTLSQSTGDKCLCAGRTCVCTQMQTSPIRTAAKDTGPATSMYFTAQTSRCRWIFDFKWLLVNTCSLFFYSFSIKMHNHYISTSSEKPENTPSAAMRLTANTPTLGILRIVSRRASACKFYLIFSTLMKMK